MGAIENNHLKLTFFLAAKFLETVYKMVLGAADLKNGGQIRQKL